MRTPAPVLCMVNNFCRLSLKVLVLNSILSLVTYTHAHAYTYMLYMYIHIYIYLYITIHILQIVTSLYFFIHRAVSV